MLLLLLLFLYLLYITCINTVTTVRECNEWSVVGEMVKHSYRVELDMADVSMYINHKVFLLFA